MKLSDFQYHCPQELIAQEPAQKRDASRLLVFKASSGIEDHTFENLPHILNQIFSLKGQKKQLLLIANNSKVYPARIIAFRKTGGQCEIFMLELESKEKALCHSDKFYNCLIKPKSKIKQNEILYFDRNQQTPIFQIVDIENSKIKPLFSEPMSEFLEKHGSTPLPPYIKRTQKKSEPIHSTTDDKSRYQNVYAHTKNTGSSAAPTAGFHFTNNLLSQLSEFNIDIDYVTLHIGLGTFLPVKVENISEHVMHQENYFISVETVKKIFAYIKNDWPIVFVGTTSLRSIESFFRKISNENKNLNIHDHHFLQIALTHANKWHSTNLFLYPEDENTRQTPMIGNALLTNFHQPESSLLMLVANIIGFHNMKEIYKHAINKKYRFFSYGDSSLLIF